MDTLKKENDFTWGMADLFVLERFFQLQMNFGSFAGLKFACRGVCLYRIFCIKFLILCIYARNHLSHFAIFEKPFVPFGKPFVPFQLSKEKPFVPFGKPFVPFHFFLTIYAKIALSGSLKVIFIIFKYNNTLSIARERKNSKNLDFMKWDKHMLNLAICPIWYCFIQ